MNIDQIAANTNPTAGITAYEQFLAQQRLNEIDQQQQTIADNEAADFQAAQTAQATSEQQFLDTVETNDLAMLQALQSTNNLATLLGVQGGDTADVFTTANAIQATNAFLNVNTLLQETQPATAGGAAADTALFPALGNIVTLNLANTLLQSFGGTPTQTNESIGAFDVLAMTNANNTINTTLNQLFGEIQINAIFGILNNLNVNTAGNVPTTSTAP